MAWLRVQRGPQKLVPGSRCQVPVASCQLPVSESGGSVNPGIPVLLFTFPYSSEVRTEFRLEIPTPAEAAERISDRVNVSVRVFAPSNVGRIHRNNRAASPLCLWPSEIFLIVDRSGRLVRTPERIMESDFPARFDRNVVLLHRDPGFSCTFRVHCDETVKTPKRAVRECWVMSAVLAWQGLAGGLDSLGVCCVATANCRRTDGDGSGVKYLWRSVGIIDCWARSRRTYNRSLTLCCRARKSA
jgi:hypothetical protein